MHMTDDYDDNNDWFHKSNLINLGCSLFVLWDNFSPMKLVTFHVRYYDRIWYAPDDHQAALVSFEHDDRCRHFPQTTFEQSVDHEDWSYHANWSVGNCSVNSDWCCWREKLVYCGTLSDLRHEHGHIDTFPVHCGIHDGIYHSWSYK